MIVTPPPSHTTETRRFADEDGRRITVNVVAPIGAGTSQIFRFVPFDWKLQKDPDIGPFGMWGLSILVMTVVGCILFFGSALFAAAGWLPPPPPGYYDPLHPFLVSLFQGYARLTIIVASVGLVAACIAKACRANGNE